MLREPICRMSAYSATNEHVVFRHHLGDDGQARLLRERWASIFRPSRPMTLKCIRRTARLEGASAKNAGARAANMMAVARSWNSVSTEHGPAMVMKSSPPISRSSTGTTVCWCSVLFKTSGGLGKTLVPTYAHPRAPFRGRLRLLRCVHPASIQRWRCGISNLPHRHSGSRRR